MRLSAANATIGEQYSNGLPRAKEPALNANATAANENIVHARGIGFNKNCRRRPMIMLTKTSRRPRRVTFTTLWMVLAVATCSRGIDSACASKPAESPPVEEPCVILVSLDGFAQFYVDDPKTHMPTLRRMIREGAVADQGLTCSFPTVTWPNHTTMVTGVPPAKHGVLANMVFDRVKAEPVQLLVDPVFDKDEVVKVPTIYDVAHAAGMRTAAIVWPATRNAKTLTWTVPDMKSPLFERFATPGWLDELRAEGIPVDRYGPWVDAKEGGPRRDWIATREVMSLLHKKDRPNVILLHLIELDHAQHETGPRTGDAYWAVSTMDDRIRDLRDTIETVGLANSTTLLITSDHGFFATEKVIHPNVKLRDMGLITMEGNRPTSRTAWSVAQGGAAAVYIIDGKRRDEIAEQVKHAMESVEGIEAVFADAKGFQSIGQATVTEDKFAPDVWLAAKDGYSFSNQATGDSVVTSKKRDGTHGYLPHHPEMRGIFIAWGRGVKPGTKLGVVENTQIAGTMAHLLGLKLPPPAQSGIRALGVEKSSR